MAGAELNDVTVLKVAGTVDGTFISRSNHSVSHYLTALNPSWCGH